MPMLPLPSDLTSIVYYSQGIYLHEITKRKFLVSDKNIGLCLYMQPKPLHVFPKIILKVLVPKNIEE